MKIRILRLTLFLVTCLAFTPSCKTDFEVNEKWKEIPIIYGLLDHNDSIQYIRIEKAYLNNDQSAIKLAQNSDSIYYGDSLDVTLEKWQGTTKFETVHLFRVPKDKDPGSFSNSGAYVYRTPVGWHLAARDTFYKLFVRNPKTGMEASSQTPIVNDAAPFTPSQGNNTINFRPGNTGYMTFDFMSGTNARSYDCDILLPIGEYNSATNSLVGTDSLVFHLFKNNRMRSLDGGTEVPYTILGNQFFEFLEGNLTQKTGIYRKFLGPQFIIAGAGDELFNYIQVNIPSLGVVQKKPDYTNINNGFGIFSSRNVIRIQFNFGKDTWTELTTNPKLSVLDFRK